MKKEEFIKKLYDSIVRENKVIYTDLFNNTKIEEVTDDYWIEALKFYDGISEDSKEVFFKIIKQIEIDAISNFLGILDGTVTLGDEIIDVDVLFKENQEKINGDLQDLFLEYDEEQK